jgi:hypothetical protein
MTADKRDFLLQPLDETRLQIEEIIPKIDPAKEIYPGWTIRQMLAHITGWDDASIDALRAHALGRSPSIPAIHSLDEYNNLTVTSHKDLNFDQILKEWRLKRLVLRDIIKQLPEEKILEPIAVPWGKKTTLPKLLDIFSHHEKEHTQDVNEWLKHPEKPLGKEGK